MNEKEILEGNKAVSDWIPIDFNKLPPELLIMDWKHPEYGIITGSMVIYHPTYRHGDNSTSYWIFPDPDTMEHSADIWIEEFTHYRRHNTNKQ